MSTLRLARLALLGGLSACAGAGPQAEPAAPAPAGAPAAAPAAAPVAVPSTSAPGAAAVQATAPHAPGALDDNAWAALLVAPPHGNGSRQGIVATWVDMVAHDPAHPLAEGTLALISRSFAEVEDPAGLAERIRSLDLAGLAARGLSPMGQRELQRLQGRLAVGYAPVEALGQDQFPGWLSRFAVLGPLDDVGDPLRFRGDSPEFREPGFGDEHPAFGQGRARPADVPANVRWQPLQRSPLRPLVVPEAVIPGRSGWVLLATAFEASDGGPAWIEIETSNAGRPDFPYDAPGDGAGARRPDWEASSGLFAPARGFDRAQVAMPFSVSLNGGEPAVVDPLGREASALVRLPVSLEAGPNRLVLAAPVGLRVGIAIRVLDTQGLVRTDLRELAPEAAPLAPRASAGPAGPPPARTQDLLLARAEARTGARGGSGPGLWPLDPPQEALLGLLQFLDGQEAEGLDHLRSAHEAAPSEPGLAALLANLTARADFLPDAWRKGEARRLAEEAVARDATCVSAALRVAQVAADEDREGEAIALLRALSEACPRQSDSDLALADVYARLGMDVSAEAALLAAQSRTPQRPAVLDRLADLVESRGQYQRATELRLDALRAGGASGPGLVDVAGRLGILGRRPEAELLLQEALQRDDSPPLRLAWLRHLDTLERWDEADALLASLGERLPWWATVPRERAAIALRRGDRDGEVAQLEALLALQPGDRPARERLAALGRPDPAREAFAAWGADTEAVRRAWDGSASKDSVVKVLDHSVVHVRPDGSMVTWTQDLYQARDLAGCEDLGSQRTPGEVLSIATIKPDGSVFEPVSVNGEFVMPNLKPGDFVLSVTRRDDAAPRDGVVRLGAWFFESDAEPFPFSRYVVDLPKSLPVRLEQNELEGRVTHEVHDAGDRVVHVFEAKDRPRVLPEPHVPPRDLWLPWVEFGMDADEDQILAGLVERPRELARVTPAVRRAALKALAELPEPAGDEARARALYAFVDKVVVKRGFATATETLLTREGSGNVLYSALLDAAGVPHQLAWCRGVSPEADPEPDPPFIEDGYWSRRLYVLVTPRDGEPAWCDLETEGLPYGRILADSPGAPCVLVPSRERVALPQRPLTDRPSFAYEISVEAQADGSAEATLVGRPSGGLEFIYKTPLREMPAVQRQAFVTQVAAGALRGLDVKDWSLPHLDDDEGLVVRAAGHVRAFLDDDGRSLGCDMPFQRLELTGQVAGGEGPRGLPLFGGQAGVREPRLRIALAPGLAWDELPASLEQPLAGGTYRLDVRRGPDGALEIERRVELPPFSLAPAEHAAFAAACARIDAAERQRLRVVRVAPPESPAGSDPAAAPAAGSDPAKAPAVVPESGPKQTGEQVAEQPVGAGTGPR